MNFFFFFFGVLITIRTIFITLALSSTPTLLGLCLHSTHFGSLLRMLETISVVDWKGRLVWNLTKIQLQFLIGSLNRSDSYSVTVFFFFFFFLVAFLFLNGNLLDNNSFITVANQWKLKIVTVLKKGQIWYNNGKLCSQTLPQILKPNHFINSFICCLFEPIEKNTHTHPQRPREETTASLSLSSSPSLSLKVCLCKIQ